MSYATVEEPYAGFVSRFIAFVLDLVIISLISFLFTAFLGLIIDFFGLDSAIMKLSGGLIIGTLQSIILIIGALFSSTFGLVYFLFFWTLAGITPGKALLGLRVVRSDGQPLTLGRAVVRFVGYWVSALALFLGFFWIIVDQRRQGWHDKLSGSVVVYDWQLRARQ